MNDPLPSPVESELDALLSRPTQVLVEFMRRLRGDLMVLGVAGKMGVSLAMQAKRAAEEADVDRKVFGVARFSDARAQEVLEAAGVETIACDLLEREAVESLPGVENILFLAGRKFGTETGAAATWAANTVLPANVAEHFRTSRLVVFSTGCVYPLVTPATGGCCEEDPVEPMGEYAQSCLGRERVFEFYADRFRTPICLLRLNYAIDLRYGVLHDLAQTILRGEPVDLSVGYFNCIWQGDATAQALLALEHCLCPPKILNLTGPEICSVREVAVRLAQCLGRSVQFAGHEGGTAYLSNASLAHQVLGEPTVELESMIRWTADWVAKGGRSLGLPTHFQVRDGRF